MKARKTRKLLSLAIAVITLLSVCIPASALSLTSSTDLATLAQYAQASAYQKIENMKVSSYSALDSDSSRKKVDAGHIYVGYAIENGILNAANSNWKTANTSSIVFNNKVAGPGFTALYATGKGTNINVTGSLDLTDSSKGEYASDFTGTGVSMVVNDYAKVKAENLTINTKGFVRAAAIVYNSAELYVDNCSFVTLGANPLTEAYDGYVNSANTNMMISPPWVLGIQGGIRTINVLGTKATLTIVNSRIASGGWGVLSSDGCTSPVFNIVDSSLEILSKDKGGMESGGDIFGYSKGQYGSGYGSYVIGNVTENFYGTQISGAAYGVIAREGTAVYKSSKGPIDLYNAYGEKIDTVAGKSAASVINTVWGAMTHANSEVNVSFIDGTEVNTEMSTFLYRDASTANFTVDNAKLNPGNGIILQMMDDDDTTVGGFSPFNSYLYEDAGLPSGNGNVTGGSAKNQVNLKLSNGVYNGSVYNGTGYYNQAADILNLTIGSGAEVHGDVALTETFHAIPYSENAIQILKGFGDDVAYVLMDSGFNVVADPAKAAYIQFTKFSINQYYLLCHVSNHLYYNGSAAAQVTVKDGGKWYVKDTSIITYLNVDAASAVYGAITDNGDGSFTLKPGSNPISNAVYGKAAVVAQTAAATGGMGGGPMAGGAK